MNSKEVEYGMKQTLTSSNTSELGLIRMAASGDERALRELIAIHEASIAQTVTAILGSGDDAEDVGQETFIRFFNALPRFRGDASVRTYLTRIAVNLSIDALKRRKRTLGWLRIGSAADANQIRSPDETDQVEREDIQSRVREAVDSLDAGSKAVVVLRVLEERSVKETAEILGIPDGTVMSRLKRSMAKLEGQLKALRPT
jgi:RNA polymerase sigma-70 factor (ECF subfamily)